MEPQSLNYGTAMSLSPKEPRGQLLWQAPRPPVGALHSLQLEVPSAHWPPGPLAPGAMVLLEVRSSQPHTLLAGEHLQGVGIDGACTLQSVVGHTLEKRGHEGRAQLWHQSSGVAPSPRTPFAQSRARAGGKPRGWGQGEHGGHMAYTGVPFQKQCGTYSTLSHTRRKPIYSKQMTTHTPSSLGVLPSLGGVTPTGRATCGETLGH